jgi:hypothetical protein
MQDANRAAVPGSVVPSRSAASQRQQSPQLGCADRRRITGGLSSLFTLPASTLIGKKRLKAEVERYSDYEP